LAQRAQGSIDLGVILSAIAQVDARTEETSRRILKQYEQFLQSTAAETDERLETAPPNITEEGQRRAADVTALEELWKEVEATR
jgi:hypothetical protein